MANKFTLTFTGTNGDPWPGLTRVAGGQFDATIDTNQGGSGATGAERLYQADSFPGIRDHLVEVDAIWDNAVSSGRAIGLCSRVTDDGQIAYIAMLYSYRPSDNTLNSPHIRVFRRRAGTNTEIVTETDISGTISGAALNAGVTIGLRVENTDIGEVNLQVSVDGTVFVDHDDTSVPIESGGTAGLYLLSTSTNDDVLVDNLSISDFEAEAPDTEWESGLGMLINGLPYNAAQIEALGIATVDVVISYDSGGGDVVAEITDLNDLEQPALKAGDDITVVYNGTVLARGKVWQASGDGGVDEGHTFQVYGPKSFARSVPITHPDSYLGTVVFNAGEDSEFYDEDLQDMTVGDILEWVLDNHSEGGDGLRAVGAAPPTGTVYTIPSGLSSGPVIPEVTVNGNVAQAIESVLAFMPSYFWRVNPDTLAHEFHHRPSGVLTTLDTDESRMTVKAEAMPHQAFTAVLIRGGQPQVTYVTKKLSDNSLQEGWDTSLGEEGNYDVTKKNKNYEAGTVAAFGTQSGGPNDGFVYIDPDQTGGAFTMTAGEWRRVGCYFHDPSDESGTTYYVRDNSTSRIWLTASAWNNGGPSVSDGFHVAGVAGEDRDNLWNAMFRVYQVTDAGDREIADGECGDITFRYPLPGGGEGTQALGGEILPGGKIRLSQPLILPTSILSSNGGAGCGNTGAPIGGDDTYGDLEIQVPVKAATVPVLRVPTSPGHFRGTAYTADPDKWDGGGEPGVGDPGVKSVMVLDDPNFIDAVAQATDYTALADSLLEVYGELPVRASIKVEEEILLDLAGLNFRIQIDDTLGGRLTGYEDITSLWGLEVRYSLMPGDEGTQITCGTMSSYGGINLDTIRKKFTDTTKQRQYLETIKAMQKMMECRASQMNANATGLGGAGDAAQCASQIEFTYPPTESDPGGKTNVQVSIEILIEILEALFDLIEWQKGGTFSVVPDGDGGYQLQLETENGTTFIWDPDAFDGAGGWVEDGNPGNVTRNPLDDDGSPLPIKPPEGGLEGQMADLLIICLENLGKTVNFDGTDITEVKPGAPIPNDGTPTIGFGSAGPGGSTGTATPGGTAGPNLPGRVADLKANKIAEEQKNSGVKIDPDNVVDLIDAFAKRHAADGPNGFVPDVTNTNYPAGPAPGGLIGNGLGKCGSTLDGVATPSGSGSGYTGPGGLIAPGSTVGSDGAFYLPPSEQGGQPEIIYLESGMETPASTLGILFKLAEFLGLEVYDKSDPIGVVFTDGSAYYVLNPDSNDFEAVQAASGGAGTGVNDGDWEYVSPTVVFDPEADVGGVTLLHKESTEARASSTGLIADSDLQFTFPGTAHYAFEAFLIIDGDDTDDVQVDIQGTGPVTFSWSHLATNAGADAPGPLVVNTTGHGNQFILRIEGMADASGGADMAIYWTSNGSSGVDARMKEGSWMRVTRLD